jgi:hypothetical protein
MSELFVTGVGITTPTGVNSEAALHHRFPDVAASGEPPVTDRSRDRKVLPHIRYKDPIVLGGVISVQGALAAAQLEPAVIQANPFRYGILLATARGPERTRASLFQSLESRDGKSVSATFFSSCGYNIAGSLLAASAGIVGPVLTLACSEDALGTLCRCARRHLGGSRSLAMVVGFTEGDSSVMLVIEPEDPVRHRALSRRIPVRFVASVRGPADAEFGGFWQCARQWYGLGDRDDDVVIVSSESRRLA